MATKPAAKPVSQIHVMRDVVLAFVRVHVLHHSAVGPIFGLEMMEELRRLGYRIGPGTLYRCCMGWRRVASCNRRTHRSMARRAATIGLPGPETALAELRKKIAELVQETSGGND